MQRIPGVGLDKVWEDMSGPTRVKIIQKLAQYDVAFATCGFALYGSLYYPSDLPDVQPSQAVQLDASIHPEPRTQFAIGPTTNRAYFDDLRGEVEPDLGPCKLLTTIWIMTSDKLSTGLTFDEYILSRTDRELKCLKRFNKIPHQQGLFYGPGRYIPTNISKTQVLNAYSKAAPLLTLKDTALTKPALWHPDLHADNIFVDPNEPTEIVSIIDWQAVNISPLFLQVRHPSLVKFEGPITQGFEPIKLPDRYP
jgi:hypothetical protein